MAVAIGLMIMSMILRRKYRDDANLAFRDLAPTDLGRLQSKGLLTPEEAKRLQAVIAKKTMESLEQAQTQSNKKPEVQDLLRQAEDLRLRHHQKHSPRTEDRE
jgi:hypothetical protein